MGLYTLSTSQSGSDRKRIGLEEDDVEKAYENGEICDDLRGDASQTESAPRRTRTFDPLIKSQLLYQLS